MRSLPRLGSILFCLVVVLIWPLGLFADEFVPSSSDSTTIGIATGQDVTTQEALASDSSTRSDVAVIIWGGWEGMAVRLWVGDQEFGTLYTATNSNGEQQVTWTLYPSSGEYYAVCVEPIFVDGIDSTKWNYRLVSLSGGSAGYSSNGHNKAGCLIPSSSQTTFYFQLEEASAETKNSSISIASFTSDDLATDVSDNEEASTTQTTIAEELPHAGVLDDLSSFSLLNRLLILGGGLFLGIMGRKR